MSGLRKAVEPFPGAVEPVRFDWSDESTYEAARKGVDGIFVVTGGIPQPHHGDRVRTLLDGAAAAWRR